MRRAVVAAAMGWLLWQGVAPVLPNAPTEGAAVNPELRHRGRLPEGRHHQ